MTLTQPTPFTGKGARKGLLLAVAMTLLLMLAANPASAEPRLSRLHRPSAARNSAARVTDAQEPHSIHATHLRSHSAAARSRQHSQRDLRRSPTSSYRASRRAGRLSSRRFNRAELARYDTRSLHTEAHARGLSREWASSSRSSAAIYSVRRARRRREGSRAEIAASRQRRSPVVEATLESNDAFAAPAERPSALRPVTDRQADANAGTSPQPADSSRAASREELADEAVQPVVLPGLYRNGRLVMPAPLRGTRDILVHQNVMADDEGLERIRDDQELDRLRATHQLVDFPESASLRVNPELALDRRCARVWTVRFAADIAGAFYARFHEPLQVNSAVRTVQYQLRLQRVNGNAAPVAGDVASPHLTGQAIDFGKGEMSRDEIAWMRAYLLPLMQSGKLDVEEEFQQACFHISVYRSYTPALRRRPVVKAEVAEVR